VGCGLLLTVKDGEIINVEGDEEHPITQGRLCPRCLAIGEFLNHPDRIIYPMKRDSKDRGKNAWERISWDEALDIIEERVNYIKANWGPESIIVFKGTGRQVVLYSEPMAFAALGTPHCVFPMSGLSCYGPRCAVTDFILGAGYPEMDYAQYFPDRYDDPRYKVPECIVLWGKNPLESNGDGLFGHSIVDLMKRGSKIITIDPRLTWAGARAACHLQIRPGTDPAIGLGIINVIIEEELYDKEFVEEWCFGFEKLKVRAAEYPLETVEKITWVPKEKILAAARLIAQSKPCTFLWGVALDSNTNGVQGSHCMLNLAAITGNLDIPGGLIMSEKASFMGKWRFETAMELPEGIYEKRIYDPKYIAFATGNPESSHPDATLDYLEMGEDAPTVLKMAWFYGTNLLSCTAAQPQRWLNGLMGNEFNVAQDVVMTPTAMALADLFLPVSAFPEHDGIVLPHFGRNTHMLCATNKAIEIGECKSDLEIDLAVGKRLNPKAWPWENVSEFFTEQIQTQYDWTFDDLRSMGVFQQDLVYRKFEKGMLRYDGEPGFNTPTGLIELSSSLYPDWGDDSLPYFVEPVFSPYSRPDLAEKYPLVLTTGGRNIESFHSEHRHIPSLRRLVPDPVIEMHPETAKKYGIEDGDWVCIENMFGRSIQRARVCKILDPRVVHATHAWWYPEEEAEAPNLYGLWKSNLNTLVPHDIVGKFGYGAPYKSLICSIRKVENKDACGNEAPAIVKEV
jgi:anaerobic selenocysteine-containing dehydrogenase